MYKNMKIAITDEAQLKAVCDVLKTMGFVKSMSNGVTGFIYTFIDGSYRIDINHQPVFDHIPYTNLTDLLALRDKHFMEKIHAAD